MIFKGIFIDYDDLLDSVLDIWDEGFFNKLITLAGGIGIIYWFIRLIKWVFNLVSSPMFIKVFLIILGALITIFSISGVIGNLGYLGGKKRLEELLKKKEEYILYNKLENEIRETLKISIIEDSINSENYNEAQSLFDEAKKTLGNLNTMADRRKLADIKLRLFYLLSVSKETEDDSKLQKQMHDLYLKCTESNNYMLLRQDDNEKNAANEEIIPSEEKISIYEKALKNNRMTRYLNKLGKTKEADTTKFLFFRDLDKLSEQTQTMAKLQKSIYDEYKELSDIAPKINEELKLTRIMAFRNIYLGVELINLCRDNAGGSTLTTQKDIASLGTMDMDLGHIEIGNLSVKSGKIAWDTFSNTMDLFSSTEFKSGEQAVKAIGISAAAALVKTQRARNQAIDENYKYQVEYLNNIERIVNEYNEGRAKLLRIIEIGKAITNANKGFLKIYAPLRDKVFLNNQMLDRQEVVELATAMKEYNKIASATIK